MAHGCTVPRNVHNLDVNFFERRAHEKQRRKAMIMIPAMAMKKAALLSELRIMHVFSGELVGLDKIRDALSPKSQVYKTTETMSKTASLFCREDSSFHLEFPINHRMI